LPVRPRLTMSRYVIFLDFEGFRYRGHETIELESQEDVRLDAEGVKVTSVRANGKEVEFSQDEKGLTLRTGRFSGFLEVDFEGEAAERLVGIYRAKQDNDYYISTQFESVHARKMFPCVDDPAYKARFKLTVRVPREPPRHIQHAHREGHARGGQEGRGVLRDAPHVDLPPLPWRRQVGGAG